MGSSDRVIRTHVRCQKARHDPVRNHDAHTEATEAPPARKLKPPRGDRDLERADLGDAESGSVGVQGGGASLSMTAATARHTGAPLSAANKSGTSLLNNDHTQQ